MLSENVCSFSLCVSLISIHLIHSYYYNQLWGRREQCDEFHLSVMHYINDTWLMSIRMVKAARRVGIDISNIDVEAPGNLFGTTETVGEAWEDVSKAGDGFNY